MELVVGLCELCEINCDRSVDLYFIVHESFNYCEMDYYLFITPAGSETGIIFIISMIYRHFKSHNCMARDLNIPI